MHISVTVHDQQLAHHHTLCETSTCTSYLLIASSAKACTSICVYCATFLEHMQHTLLSLTYYTIHCLLSIIHYYHHCCCSWDEEAHVYRSKKHTLADPAESAFQRSLETTARPAEVARARQFLTKVTYHLLSQAHAYIASFVLRMLACLLLLNWCG
jgi:hypothetical protein